tara:strand:+ start:186 stop:710 length:525 start_codon:yes stop_codon:yes gene_type:complete
MIILKRFFFKKVQSTNNLAIRKINSGFSNGIIIADYQTNGRGQYGRKWISFKGNLFISVFFKVKKNLSIKKMTNLNCTLLKTLFSKIAKRSVSIKYPNDLLLNKKKFCGILQETQYSKNSKFLVIGIGVNLVKNPKIKNYPTTNIFKETGLKIKKTNLINNIAISYVKKLKLFA